MAEETAKKYSYNFAVILIHRQLIDGPAYTKVKVTSYVQYQSEDVACGRAAHLPIPITVTGVVFDLAAGYNDEVSAILQRLSKCVYGKAPMLTPLAVGFRGLFGLIVSSLSSNRQPGPFRQRIPIFQPYTVASLR